MLDSLHRESSGALLHGENSAVEVNLPLLVRELEISVLGMAGAEVQSSCCDLYRWLKSIPAGQNAARFCLTSAHRRGLALRYRVQGADGSRECESIPAHISATRRRRSNLIRCSPSSSASRTRRIRSSRHSTTRCARWMSSTSPACRPIFDNCTQSSLIRRYERATRRRHG
jgi:hypothetical protein